MRIGSLFSGIGGLELGLERAGLGVVVWQVEVDPFRRGVLAKHWPRATRFEDVRTATRLPPVDVLCGGFPCQDVSSASRGRGGGIDGKKSGLWNHYARIVGEQKPRLVVVENVASGHREWLPTVRRDLHVLGYRTRALRVDARDVGAPHGRPRIFVVAHPHADGEPALPVDGKVGGLPPAPSFGGEWRVPFAGPFRVDDGLPSRMDRVMSLGDAVVPACAEFVGRLIRRAA